MDNRPVLYLLGKKGLRVLEALKSSGRAQTISAVVYAKDPALQYDYSQDILALCKKSGIPVHDRKENKSSHPRSQFALAIGWRWIITPDQHETVIVFHDSLLPKYRGFAPLVAQLINGENEIGVTALLASDEYDKGPIISQKSIRIDYPLKVESAINLIAPLYEALVMEVLHKICSGENVSKKPQVESDATYSVWRDEQDLNIDWLQSNERIERFVNATGYPFKGAFTYLDGRRIVISDVKCVKDIRLEFRHVGKTIRFEEEAPVVICGKGLLLIKGAKWYDSGEDINKWPRFRMRFK